MDEEPKRSYLVFDNSGVRVDLKRFLSTEAGKKKFRDVAKSAFPKKYKKVSAD